MPDLGILGHGSRGSTDLGNPVVQITVPWAEGLSTPASVFASSLCMTEHLSVLFGFTVWVVSDALRSNSMGQTNPNEY